MTPATVPKPQAGTGTVRVTRVIKAPRKRVFDAFLDPDCLAKWTPPGGFTAKVHHYEPRVGGKFRMSFTDIGTRQTSTFGGEYLEIKPHDLIRHTDKFETDHPEMQGILTVTITFKDVPGGTEVHVLQEGLPKIIPLEGAQAGWAQSMENLARLVEVPSPA